MSEWSRTHAVKVFSDLFDEQKAKEQVPRLLRACDLAGVGYDTMYRRLMLMRPLSPAPETPSSSPCGSSVQLTESEGGEGEEAPLPVTGCWKERVDNLCSRYDISRSYAHELLMTTNGHAGKASRLITQNPPPSPSPSLLSSESPNGSPLARTQSAYPSHSNYSMPPSSRLPPTSYAPISEGMPTIPDTIVSDLISETEESSAPQEEGICTVEVMDSIGTTPSGRYLMCYRKKWGCVAFFDVGIEFEGEKPSWDELTDYTPIATVLFVELGNVEYKEETDQQVGQRNSLSPKHRSRGSTMSCIARLVGVLGQVRLRLQPLDYMDTCENLQSCIVSAQTTPFLPCTASGVELYRDGVMYYPALSAAIKAATRSVYIAGWFLSPQVYLSRTMPLDQNERIDNILQRKAFEGVKIYILLYAEVEAAIALGSANAASLLESLHPDGISVLRHRGPLAFTHHQKFVVIDSEVAFVGGLDLAWGRYDTHDHPVTDSKHEIWKGLDYRNPVLRADDISSQVKMPFNDTLDRQKQPRMPWHDVHMKAVGRVAYDVGLNFIQRWNHHVTTSKKKKKHRLSPHLPAATPRVSRRSKILRTQVIRSLGEWSGACKPERCLHDTIVRMIRSAKNSVYIENQYFISSIYGSPVTNGIATVLADRINNAVRRKETFRCVLVLQPHGEGNPLTDPYIQRVVHFQNATLRKLLKRIKAVAGSKLDDYILIGCLRNHAQLDETFVTSPVYVHSKLVIVDDEQAVIGSANINDRSMVGDRDSELAVYLDDTIQKTNAIRNFRRDLIEEHLCEQGVAEDLLNPTTWGLIKSRSVKNQAAYEAVFPYIPSDGVHTAEVGKGLAGKPIPDGASEKLEKIKGRLCRYPVEWFSKAGQDKSIAERAAGTDFFV